MTVKRNGSTQSAAWQAVLAGAAGGLLGTLAMSYAQRAWTLAADGRAPRSAGGAHDAREWQERSEGTNANELVAQAVATRLLGRRLNDRELQIGAPLAHYAFGSTVAAAYGMVAARAHRRALARGAAFGTAVWLAADEVAMPLLSLSRPTTERPLEKHLQAFAAHLVYGVVAEFTRQSLTAQFTRQ
jgi:hypothetical protein